MNTHNYYEEITEKIMGVIYDDIPTEETEEVEYVEESIREALQYFKKADRNKYLDKRTENSSRFFYNRRNLDKFFKIANNIEFIHVLGMRSIGTSINPCYEVNFQEILDITIPEQY